MQIDSPHADLTALFVYNSFEFLRPLRRVHEPLCAHNHHLVDIPNSRGNPLSKPGLFPFDYSQAHCATQWKPDVYSGCRDSHSQMESVRPLIKHMRNYRIIRDKE